MRRLNKIGIMLGLLAAGNLAQAGCILEIDYDFNPPVAIIRAGSETFIGNDMDAAAAFYMANCKK